MIVTTVCISLVLAALRQRKHKRQTGDVALHNPQGSDASAAEREEG